MFDAMGSINLGGVHDIEKYPAHNAIGGLQSLSPCQNAIAGGYKLIRPLAQEDRLGCRWTHRSRQSNLDLTFRQGYLGASRPSAQKVSHRQLQCRRFQIVSASLARRNKTQALVRFNLRTEELWRWQRHPAGRLGGRLQPSKGQK